jgi:hypothetical protein
MTYENAFAEIPEKRGDDLAARKLRSEHPYLVDLIAVLRAHPAGLRRWSVMRAIRRKRESSSLPIHQKFEDEVERAFRRLCADSESLKNNGTPAEAALFYRPPERAGEVWAVYADRAEAWLRDERIDFV